ncbi:MAG: hypothetical protein K1X74_21340 [Pirellulales bacterium]|nr:hypothetical protein [Pirellulales bacterium]
MSRNSNARRGIILLVVMSIIALFAVITIGFVLVSSLELRTASLASKADQKGDAPGNLADAVMDQVLVGSKNPNSVIGPHSLLEDIYGADAPLLIYLSTSAGKPVTSLRATINGAQIRQYSSGGTTADLQELIEIRISGPAFQAAPPVGYFNGRLITFANGKTVRVLDTGVFTPAAYTPAQQALTVFNPGVTSNTVGSLAGTEVLINDRPFDGTGFGLGYESLSAIKKIDRDPGHMLSTHLSAKGLPADASKWPDWPQAFLPNRTQGARTPYERSATGGDDSYPDFAGLGGADEDYDAPDYQNMLLAMVVQSSDINVGTLVPLPSLHRPDLIRFWRNQKGGPSWVPNTGDAMDRSLLRKIVMRPLWFDHPGFASVNPQLGGASPLTNLNGLSATDAGGAFDPVNTAWDVDNDGDGKVDSIWVDVGLPVQTDSRGRRFKPLAAILCVDMDGRLNLNTHSGPDLLREPNGTLTGNPRRGDPSYTFRGPFANQSGQAQLPLGSGFGPADVQLPVVFNTSTTTMQELQQLVFGKIDNTFVPPRITEGRNGEGVLLSNNALPMPGRTTLWSQMTASSQLGIASADDDQDGNPDDESERMATMSSAGTSVPFMQDDNFPPPATHWLPLAANNLDSFRGNALRMGRMIVNGRDLLEVGGARSMGVDMDGDGSLALDLRGLPMTPSQDEGNDAVDDPYELDPNDAREARLGQIAIDATSTRMSLIDALFRPTELEGLLRAYDSDSALLAQRLYTLAPISLSPTSDGTAAAMFAASVRRRLLTTESWDLPISNGMPVLAELLPLNTGAASSLVGSSTAALQGEFNQNVYGSGVSPLYFRSGNYSTVSLIVGSTAVASLNGANREMMAPSYFDGLRFDLDRPLGNAWDDNQNGIVDEPGETLGGNPEPLWDGAQSQIGAVTQDLNNDGRPDNVDRNTDGYIDDNDVLVRHAMARQLFVMAMMSRNGAMNATGSSGREYTPQELAQWAVNVVDYIDRDSICTGFEYDANPLDGWGVDGDIKTDESSSTCPTRRVAWGVERPELLMTETLAFHDLRTEDTASDTSNKKHFPVGTPGNDTNLDQARRPEGTLVVELFNPQGIRQARSGEFYAKKNTTSGAWDLIAGVNLRVKDRATNADPVWRFVVWENKNNRNEDEIKQLRASASFPDEATNDNADLTFDDANDYKIERSIYFTPPSNPTAPEHGEIAYYPSTTELTRDAIVEPGAYAVIGPAESTMQAIVMGGDLSSTSNVKLEFKPPQPQVAASDPYTFDVIQDLVATGYPKHKKDGSSLSGSEESIRPPVGVVVDTSSAGTALRMSISEPTAATIYNGGNLQPDGTLSPPENEPFDKQAAEEWYSAADADGDGDLGPSPTSGLESDAKSDDDQDNIATPDYGTKQHNYRHLVLQRLANPALPYNKLTNPYITVDWMPLDLSLFNSTFSSTAAKIQTRQRSGASYNLFAEEEFTGTQKSAALTERLKHTLGFLNDAWHSASAMGAHRWWTPSTLAALDPKNLALNNLGYDEDYFVGQPKDAQFPWLILPNRPLVSPYELMLVPKSTPSRLLAEFSRALNLTSNTIYSDKQGRFSHLLNFFGASEKGFPSTPKLQNDLFRMFDFVNVRSRFSGTEVLLNTQQFAGYPTGNPVNPSAPNDLLFGWFEGTTGQFERCFRPPFNRISTYREPGRVNLNTIFDDGWTIQALAGGLYNSAAHSSVDLWRRTIMSRRGYAAPGAGGTLQYYQELTRHTSTFPSLVSNPFRGFSGGELAPVVPPTAMAPKDKLQRPGINCTLLRPDPITPADLDDRNDPDPSGAQEGLFELTGSTAADRPSSNPAFRYALYNRLGNTVTTRSNVYAVWITVGYFEVEPVPLNPDNNPNDPVASYYSGLGYNADEMAAVFPDGYRLKGELGSDTGDIVRHRAFYLIDRTIPVAFERGETHNARNAIILRRSVD